MKPRPLSEKRKQLYKASSIARMIRLEMEESLHKGNTTLLELRIKRAKEITTHALEIWDQIRALRAHSPRNVEKIKLKAEEFRREKARIKPLLNDLLEDFHHSKLALKTHLGALYHSYNQTINSLKRRIGSPEEEILSFEEITSLLNLLSFARTIDHSIAANTRLFWDEIHKENDYKQAA